MEVEHVKEKARMPETDLTNAAVDSVMPAWTIFSSHGMVLFYVAAHPDVTLRETAVALGITERRVVSIIKDLTNAGMVHIERRGRRNHYALNPEARLRHPTLSHVPLARIAAALKPGEHSEK